MSVPPRTSYPPVKSDVGEGLGALKVVIAEAGDIAKSGFILLENLIQLAKFNPLWGGVLGVIVTNILSHKVDFLHWQHQEAICLDCAGLTLSGNQVNGAGGVNLGQLANGIISFLPGVAGLAGDIVSLGQLFASHGGNSSGVNGGGTNASGHTYVYVWVPGVIDQSANLIITGMIISAFALSDAGAIIGDITNITHILGGSTADSASLIKPTATAFVEKGSQVRAMQTLTDVEAT